MTNQSEELVATAKIEIVTEDSWLVIGKAGTMYSPIKLAPAPQVTCPVVDVANVDEAQCGDVIRSHRSLSSVRDVDDMIVQLVKLGASVSNYQGHNEYIPCGRQD